MNLVNKDTGIKSSCLVAWIVGGRNKIIKDVKLITSIFQESKILYDSNIYFCAFFSFHNNIKKNKKSIVCGRKK